MRHQISGRTVVALLVCGIRIRVVAGRTDETSFPRPDWMDKGVSYLDRGKRDVAPLFKKAGAATTNQDK